MKRRQIGRTGVFVTEIGFGTAPIAGMPDTYGHDVDEGRARATIHAIFDSPVTLLDTSRNYAFGRAEARIGAVIRKRGGLPGGFVISIKLDRDMDTNRFDSARARRSFEESLTASVQRRAIRRRRPRQRKWPSATDHISSGRRSAACSGQTH
jgi:D-threo-aldose 1-dehydrogenase